MNSPFGWPGGKRALKKTLLTLIPAHDLYCEVFAGSAKLLFAKDPAPFEVMNDLNGEVINFFRVAKHRPAELAERFDQECIHAGRFKELRSQPGRDCELDRALRFAYLVWFSYGGKGEHFGSSSAKNANVKRPLGRVRELLHATAERLQRVMIEQRDFAWMLDRYDSAETFFYLDPPYVHFQPNARYTALSADRREELFDTLAKLQGKFLLSFDDCAEVREAAKSRRMVTRKVGVQYTLANERSGKKASELLIANYPI